VERWIYVYAQPNVELQNLRRRSLHLLLNAVLLENLHERRRVKDVQGATSSLAFVEGHSLSPNSFELLCSDLDE